jgi:uncharacterized glyoxalase superfamily protein PhnB
VAPRDYARHWTPVHADVVVVDLAAAVTRATAAGATLERPVVRRSWNAIAGLADPFGHGFDLIAEPGDPRPGVLDVAIDVPDVAAAVAFYTCGLGLDLRDEPMPGLWARLGGSAITIHLQADPARTYARHWTPVHLDFLTDDVDGAVRRARAAGASDGRPIQDAEWGRMANLADPFGHGFCLVELGAHGYDAVARNE